MMSINATLVLQVIHFLILTFILNRLFFRPILKVISERNQHIEKIKDEITDFEHEIVRLKDEYHSKDIAARKEAGNDRVQLKNIGLAKADEVINDSRQKVSSIKADADQEVKVEIEKTQPLLHGEAKSLVGEIMQKLIGRRIEA